MKCAVCGGEVKKVDNKAEAVICANCVYDGWDFTRLEKTEIKEAIE